VGPENCISSDCGLRRRILPSPERAMHFLELAQGYMDAIWRTYDGNMTFVKLAITRRMCGRMLAGAALSGVFGGSAAADTGSADRLNWGAEPSTDAGKERRY